MTEYLSRPRERFYELDAVRGLASFIVVLEHFSDLFYERNGINLDDPVSILRTTPLGILVQGPAAVATFFVLSGFVLSTPFLETSGRVSWTRFIGKRIIRLYLPFLCGFMLSVIADALFSTGGIGELNAWFNASWTLTVDFKDVLSHSLLINHYDYTEYNKAYWTLCYEMQLSLVFPILYYIADKLSKHGLAFACLVLLLLGSFRVSWVAPQVSYFLCVAGMFVAGIGVARNRISLILHYKILPTQLRWVVAILALLGFSYAGWLGKHFLITDISPAILAVAAVCTITLAIGDEKWKEYLSTKPCQFLGKISYSLYLCHLTVMYTLIYVTYRIWKSSPFYWAVIFALYVGFSIVIAIIFYRFIERPCLVLSKQVKQYRNPSATRLTD